MPHATTASSPPGPAPTPPIPSLVVDTAAPHLPPPTPPRSRQLTGELQEDGSFKLALNLPISAIKVSLLTLMVAADDVAFVVNRSPAQITSVQVG